MKSFLFVLFNVLIFNFFNFSQEISIKPFKIVEEVHGKNMFYMSFTSFGSIEENGFDKLDIIRVNNSTKKYTVRKFNTNIDITKEIIFELPIEFELVDSFKDSTQSEFLFHNKDRIQYVKVDLSNGLVTKKIITLPFDIPNHEFYYSCFAFMNESKIFVFFKKDDLQRVLSINKSDGLVFEKDFFKNYKFDRIRNIVDYDDINKIGYLHVENKVDTLKQNKIIAFNEDGFLRELIELNDTKDFYTKQIELRVNSDGTFFVFGTYTDGENGKYGLSSGIFIIKLLNEKKVFSKLIRFDELINYDKFFTKEKHRNEVKYGLSLFSHKDNIHIIGDNFFSQPQGGGILNSYSFNLTLNSNGELVSEKFIENFYWENRLSSDFNIIKINNDIKLLAFIDGNNYLKINSLDGEYSFPEQIFKFEKEKTKGIYLDSKRARIICINKNEIILCQLDISKKKVNKKKRFVNTHTYYKIKIETPTY